jgi:hypothetical protein
MSPLSETMNRVRPMLGIFMGSKAYEAGKAPMLPISIHCLKKGVTCLEGPYLNILKIMFLPIF